MPSIQALMQAKKECLELFKSTSARKAANTGFNMCFRLLFGKDLSSLTDELAVLRRKLQHQQIAYESTINNLKETNKCLYFSAHYFLEILAHNGATEDHKIYGKFIAELKKDVANLRPYYIKKKLVIDPEKFVP